VFFTVVVELPTGWGDPESSLDGGHSAELSPSGQAFVASALAPTSADSVERRTRPRSAFGERLEAGDDMGPHERM
jgi:hypothetical protein